MQDKKNFFASLTPKSALLVGIAAGFLTICTIGFIVLGVITLNKDDNTAANSQATTATKQQDATPVVTKADKPKIELFIMSYCPYGLQMQKAFLPVMELLKGKADMDIKWVSYIMHEKKEIDENNAQYCVQSEQTDKYIAYAKCFTVKGDSKTCLQEAKVDTSKMNSCIKAADSKYGISKEYSDKSRWLSGYYPQYPVHADLNTKYGVQGSPSLVINGSQVQVSRTAEAIRQAVCASFNNPPNECNTTLSATPASAGFGAGAGDDTAGVDCGS